MMSNTNSAAGIIAGASTGLYKAVVVIIASLAAISWTMILETAFLALIGGVAGWIGAELVRYTVRFVKKVISKNSKRAMIKKVNKWWSKISFWNRLRLLLASIGIGGEITIYFGDIYKGWMIVAALATFIGILLTFIIQDVDNNGIVDVFEDKEDK